MQKITVITPTIRKEGLYLVQKALKRQTFKNFEHIIISRLGEPEWYDGKYAWTLNREYNRAISVAKGELIVSWQDYTYAKPDALDKFWSHYENDKKTIVSGVGNKYQDETWTVATWQDPRKRSDQGSYYPCYFSDIEANFASIPRDALYDVGGFDEAMDERYGMDAYSVLDRLNILGGWEFYLDQTNETFSLEHGRPNRWDELNWIGDTYNAHREQYLEKPKLEYLK